MSDEKVVWGVGDEFDWFGQRLRITRRLAKGRQFLVVTVHVDPFGKVVTSGRGTFHLLDLAHGKKLMPLE